MSLVDIPFFVSVSNSLLVPKVADIYYQSG